MHILVAGYLNGAADYYGPFPTQERALQYAKSLTGEPRIHTVPLTVPYSVVQGIVWRTGEEPAMKPVETNQNLNRGGI